MSVGSGEWQHLRWHEPHQAAPVPGTEFDGPTGMLTARCANCDDSEVVALRPPVTAQRGHYEQPPLGEAQHRLDLYEKGSFTGATVACLGGPDNECRWWCARTDADCEQCSPGRHPWEPIGSCRIADWINACGLDDTYAGDEELLRWNDDHDNQPGIRSGLIETEWTGDDYVWRYPPAVTS